MTDLIPITALGATTPAHLRTGALSLTENTGLALAALALRRGQTAPRPFGLHLPDPGLWAGAAQSQGAGEATGNTLAMGAFWTGPGQWMVEASGRAQDDFAADLKRHAPGCSVTEQTDGWVCYEIVSSAGGAPVRALMERLVNLDAAAFGPGSSSRTGLEHMSVFLVRRAEDRLAIFGMRSAAASLWHALVTAAERLEEVKA